MENKKENTFVSIIKALLIIIFISGVTIGGIIAGQKLAEKNYKFATKNNVEENTKSDDSTVKYESNPLMNVHADYISATYNKNQISITETNILSEDNETLMYSGSTTLNKNISSVRVSTGLQCDATESVFIIYEDGTVDVAGVDINHNIRLEQLSYFKDYKIKEIKSINTSCGTEDESGFKAEVILQDGTNKIITE